MVWRGQDRMIRVWVWLRALVFYGLVVLIAAWCNQTGQTAGALFVLDCLVLPSLGGCQSAIMAAWDWAGSSPDRGAAYGRLRCCMLVGT